MPDTSVLLDPLCRVHERIRDAVVAQCEQADLEELARIAADTEGDTQYAIDRVSEDVLLDIFEKEVARFGTILLIAEGLAEGRVVLPAGRRESDAVWRVIMDPIDGTRGLMYQKRSAWILSGVAPNCGEETNLHDIELAVQTEIPLVKQHLADVVWCMQGASASAERINRLTGQRQNLKLQPSVATTIQGGFAMLARFFPGACEELAAIDDELVRRALGPTRRGKAHCFEDQYICSGGQLYELMAGHDRFVADLRPLVEPVLARRGQSLGLCCHPYDVCTELIARSLGVIVTDPRGGPLRAPLSIHSEVAWIGYANERIREKIEPLLQAVLQDRGLLAPPGSVGDPS